MNILNPFKDSGTKNNKIIVLYETFLKVNSFKSCIED